MPQHSSVILPELTPGHSSPRPQPALAPLSLLIFLPSHWCLLPLLLRSHHLYPPTGRKRRWLSFLSSLPSIFLSSFLFSFHLSGLKNCFGISLKETENLPKIFFLKNTHIILKVGSQMSLMKNVGS